MPDGYDFYDENALIERLSRAVKKRPHETVFLVGAPLSAPVSAGSPGVPDVDGVISLIRGEFEDDSGQLAALGLALQATGDKRYQAAFQFLQGRRGQQTANEIVRRAVKAARRPGTDFIGANFESGSDEACRWMDSDVDAWTLSPGTESLGKLVTGYPDRFGKTVLTTNFDPLIEVAIRRSSGSFFRTSLHLDGNLSQTEGIGCHVIHLHGYWHGSDTLHTVGQLGQPRPRLRASLGQLLRHKLVVVCAYSGWDDVFTEALMDIVRDDAASPEIIWTFYSDRPAMGARLSEMVAPGICRGRVSLYKGIDCHKLFPRLYETWLTLEPPAAVAAPMPSNPVRPSQKLSDDVRSLAGRQVVIEGDDEDRPPVVDICVGRETEMQILRDFKGKALFLTGIGGQGKSTLAARYFTDAQTRQIFSFYIWRDCKEEGERFENQLASLIETLSAGKIRGEDLSKRSIQSIVDLLLQFTKDIAVLFVFDNADHYVDLETIQMGGSADVFIRELLVSDSKCRAIFTCRPSVNYANPLCLSCHLEGIDLAATQGLFEQRGAAAAAADIKEAHRVTEGHAFWLDLLAIQVAKRPSETPLDDLLDEIRTGRGPLPEKTLNSIWGTLKAREQLVLRGMAETVKPVSEAEIGEYLRHELGYGKVIKALKALRALNLVVIKRHPNAPEVLELHPLVRRFVQQNFRRDEQISFINGIIGVYKRLIGAHRAQLREQPTLSILQYWTQNVELDVAAEKTADAFLTLVEVAEAYMSSAYSREYCRTARLLLDSVNWVADHGKYKGFEAAFGFQVRILSYLGEHAEVDLLLDGYDKTFVNKDSRYINYCEMRSFSKWVRGQFTEALEWGRTGDELRKSSGVDTVHDVSHTLALALRDAGKPEEALPILLEGRQLSDVVDSEELDERRGGAYYGNIGRCLHFMGQIDTALTCYQKSALLVEKESTSEHILNQGYIRLWIAELFVARAQLRLAHVFSRAAFLKWEHVYPAKASTAAQLADQMGKRLSQRDQFADIKFERICLDWILGRSVDAQFA
jgi:tetratricopeptide (TPR) repeat protein